MAVEGGSLGAVLITEMIFWGVMFLIALIYTVWKFMQDERPAVTDSREAICAKKVRIVRRDMSLYSTLAYVLMFVAALMTYYEIGTTARPNGVQVVNWTYLAITAFAWAALGFLHALYFWFPFFGHTLALALAWWGSFALLAVGPLWVDSTSRDVFFGLAVALQGVSVGLVAFFSGYMGPLWRWRGWVTVVWVLLAFAVFDIFWYIGYQNAQTSATELNSRWKSQLPFFLANVSGLVISAAAAAWTYKAKRADIDATIAEMNSDAAGAATAAEEGYPLTSNVDGKHEAL